MNLPDLKHLATFMWVVRTGSFSGAAAHLNMTQPAVSNRIAELEARLGVRLFERSTRSCHVTAKGRALLEFAERIFALTDQIRSDISESREVVGIVRIGIPEPVALTWLPSLLIELERRMPRLQVEIEVGLSRELLPKVLAFDLDLACVAGPASMDGIASEAIGELKLAWLGSPETALPTVITPQALTGQAFLLHTGSRHWPAIEAWLHAGECWPRRIVRCNSIPGLIQSVVGGVGISVLPVSTVASEIASGLLRVIPSRSPLPANPFSIIHADRPLDLTIRLVLQATRDVANAHMLS
ncbi:LysR family transcriptional regulator [Aquabacter sp. CN5-332]|uniref:LysR family transcriptional regulator n=1 Tax=Aquabacter sp. CN5-332 TaxID=3156608 RepID=UPI0032B5DC6C